MAGLMSAGDLDPFTDDEGQSAHTLPATVEKANVAKVEKSRVKAGADSDDEGIGRLFEPTSLAPPSRHSDFGDDGHTVSATATGRGVKSKTEAAVGPSLWCGRGFHKSLQALPGKWITFGRKKGSTVLMDKSFVSHVHCKVRWQAGDRRLIMVDSSRYGTYVNDKKVVNNERSPYELKHGDKLVVRDEANFIHFDFLVDLRPVNLALTDPREIEELGVRNRPAATELERLKAKLLALQQQMRKQEDETIEDEKQYYELEVRRMELTEKAQMWAEETERLDQETKLLQDELHERRERWKKKLAELYESNKLKTRPLVELTADKQEQVAHMEMQSTELERQIYPERFALAELPELAKRAKEGLGDATEDETEQGSVRKPPPSQETADTSAQFKSASAGYAPTTPAKDSAAMMPDSAVFQEEVVPFVMGLTMKDLFGEDEDEPEANASAKAAEEPEPKKPRTEASSSAG